MSEQLAVQLSTVMVLGNKGIRYPKAVVANKPNNKKLVALNTAFTFMAEESNRINECNGCR